MYGWLSKFSFCTITEISRQKKSQSRYYSYWMSPRALYGAQYHRPSNIDGAVHSDVFTLSILHAGSTCPSEMFAFIFNLKLLTKCPALTNWKYLWKIWICKIEWFDHLGMFIDFILFSLKLVWKSIAPAAQAFYTMSAGNVFHVS